MAKRKAKDVFESAEKTKEHAYVIFPGEEMSEVTLEGSNSGKEAKFDFNQIRQLYETRKRTYVTAHEHPMKSEEHTAYLTVPSIADVRGFLLDDFARMEVVAQRNSETGKIEGYFCLRKTKKTKKVGYTPMYKDKIDRSNPELRENVKEIAQETSKYDQLVKQNRIKEGIDNLAQQFHLRYKFLPAKGYKLDDRLTNFYEPAQREEKERKIREEFERGLRKQKGLDKLLGYNFGKMFIITLSLVSFIISLLFLSTNFTGYAVFNSGFKTSNILGVILIILSFSLLFLYLKLKKSS